MIRVLRKIARATAGAAFAALVIGGGVAVWSGPSAVQALLPAAAQSLVSAASDSYRRGVEEYQRGVAQQHPEGEKQK